MNVFFNNIKDGFNNEKAFRYCYILSLFLSSLCFVEYGFQFITSIIMLWAVFLLKNRFDNFNSIRSIRFYGLIFLFLGSLLYTILTYDDNLSTNLLTLYHTAICFFLLYGIHSNSDKDSIRKEIFTICKTITILTTVFAVLGILVFLIFVRIEAFSYVIGLLGKRFTGLYTHPNIAAFASVIGIVCCHLVYKQFCFYGNRENKKVISILCYLCFIFNFLTILLSDSNAALVFLLAYSAVIIFFKLLKRNSRLKFSVIFKLGVVCIFMTLSSFAIRNVSQSFMSEFVNIIHYTESNSILSDSSNADSDILAQNSPLAESEVEIGRVERKDLSSGRFDSWRKGFELFGMNPLTGIGKGNILEYGDLYLEEGFKFFDLHNGYLTILVSCGIIGFSIFILFLFCIAQKFFKYIFFNNKKDTRDISCIPIFIGIICAYCVYSIFERTMLFENTFMVTIFWLILGYMMSLATVGEVDTAHVEVRANYANSLSTLRTQLK